MKNKKKKSLAAAVIGILLVAVLGGVAGVLMAKQSRQIEETTEAAEQPPAQENIRDEVTYEGKSYEVNPNLTNILFLGIDKEAEVVVEEVPGNGGQADCVMILSLDRETQTGRILQISRDAMTDVDIYYPNGEFFKSINQQLCTQYAYGNGEKSSCWAMEKTVGELLHDLPIHAYLSLNIRSISTLNDLIGGVTLTIPSDYTYIDPGFVQGAEATLTGAQAESYVRYRDTNVTGSNNERMVRQVQYVTALVDALKAAAGSEEGAYERFSSYLRPYMVTDMDMRQVDEFMNYEFRFEETQFVPGEAIAGEEFEEFYVDDEKLQEMLIEMFYKPAD